MVYSAAASPTGWGLVAMIMSVLLFAAVSVCGYLFLFRVRGRPARHVEAERRLADQLARGQIDEHEYRHLAAALEQADPGKRRKPRRRSTPPRRRRS